MNMLLLLGTLLVVQNGPLCSESADTKPESTYSLQAQGSPEGLLITPPPEEAGWRLFTIGADGGAQPDWRCEQCAGIPTCICGAECGRDAYFCDCLAAPPDCICRLDQCTATQPSEC